MQVTINIPTNANGELIIPVRKTESDYAIRVANVNPDNLARLFMYGVTQVTIATRPSRSIRKKCRTMS
jgi:hypothetical protein